MWELFLDLAVGLALLVWAVGMYSIIRADRLARAASRHLPRSERANYRSNLHIFPRSSWVESLLGGTGLGDHRRAVAHMRRVHIAGLAFVAICVGALLTAILVNGTKAGPSVFDRPSIFDRPVSTKAE